MKQKTYDLFISQVEKNNYEVIDNIGDYYDKINIKCKSCNKILKCIKKSIIEVNFIALFSPKP